jgi:hypothetical protein
MAVGAGFAAAIGVFSASYAKAPAWGTDWTSATGLFGATSSDSSPPLQPLPQQEAIGHRLTSATETGKHPQQTVMVSDTEQGSWP